MQFNPPANQDDLSDRPNDRVKLIALWNRVQAEGDDRFFYMGDYVIAAADNPNYVDPRDEPSSGTPDPVPWKS